MSPSLPYAPRQCKWMHVKSAEAPCICKHCCARACLVGHDRWAWLLSEWIQATFPVLSYVQLGVNFCCYGQT